MGWQHALSRCTPVWTRRLAGIGVRPITLTATSPTNASGRPRALRDSPSGLIGPRGPLDVRRRSSLRARRVEDARAASWGLGERGSMGGDERPTDGWGPVPMAAFPLAFSLGKEKALSAP